MLNYDITLQLQDCMHTIKYVVHTNLYCMFDELFFPIKEGIIISEHCYY